MNHPNLMRTAALSLVLGAGSVLAQTTPPVRTAPVAPVVSDVGPPPAEDRSSAGAIVLEDSLVKAQRERDFQRSSARTGVASVGRGAVRATRKWQVEAELAQAREAEAAEAQRRGAASLIAQ